MNFRQNTYVHPSQARYLLGEGANPGPTGPQLAAAYLQAGLDGRPLPPFRMHPAPPMAGFRPGADGSDVSGENHPAQEQTETGPPKDHKGNVITHVHFLIPTVDGKVPWSPLFDMLNKEPTDFLEQLALKLGTNRDNMSVGYKFPSDKGSATRLKGEDDVKELTKRWIRYRQNANSRDGKISIQELRKPKEDVPTEDKGGKKKKKKGGSGAEEEEAEGKAIEEACTAEFRICREKLRCNCPGYKGNGDRFCWKDPRDPTTHYPLSLEEVLNWARYMKNNPDADRTCAIRPNTKAFDKLSDEPRRQKTPKKQGGEANVPVVHVHINNSPNGEGGNERKRKLHEETLELDPIPLSDVLRQLDARMPAAKFSSYAAKLEANGFYYAQSIVDSKGPEDRDVFVQRDGVGMPRGLVLTFLREVEAIVEKARDTKRRCIRTGKENVPPEVISSDDEDNNGDDDEEF